MKAVVHTRFGSADVLELKEVDRPVPKNDEVLIKVSASSINDWDLGLMEGKPYLMRLAYGLFKPRNQLLGCDVVGSIEAVGGSVSRFSVGDKVYGDIHQCGFGALAEYVCANENALELKPSALSDEEAAAIPHAATLAWQALFDKGKLQAGQSLLINGAGGGVGPIALQLARLQGAQEITAVDHHDKLDALRSIGFDHTIDYTTQDFTRLGKQYDLILDVSTKRSPGAYLSALKPNGVYVTIGGDTSKLLQLFLAGPLISKLAGKQMKILALQANRGLSQMKSFFESGDVKPLIAGPYPLERVADAMALFSQGDQLGRIVVTVP